MDVEELLENLKAVANPDDAAAMKAYMKNKFEFLGVKSLARRKLTKTLFKQQTNSVIDWNFINESWDNPYRELQYAALDYLEIRKKLLTPSDLPRLKKLAQTKSWWDTIDFWTAWSDPSLPDFQKLKGLFLLGVVMRLSGCDAWLLIISYCEKKKQTRSCWRKF